MLHLSYLTDHAMAACARVLTIVNCIFIPAEYNYQYTRHHALRYALQRCRIFRPPSSFGLTFPWNQTYTRPQSIVQNPVQCKSVRNPGSAIWSWFGLSNDPSAFQRWISNVLRTHNSAFSLVYFDDVLLFSISLDEHYLIHLNTTLLLLANVTDYCVCQNSYAKNELQCLGH